MFKVKIVKIASGLVILFAAVISPLVAWGATTPTVITLNAEVAAIVEWDAATYTILAGDWTGLGVFDTRSHAAMTVSKNILLWTNVNVTIDPSTEGTDGFTTLAIQLGPDCTEPTRWTATMNVSQVFW